MSGMSRLGVWAGVAAAAGLGVGAQMHKVARPETVVRAVGVYEWTGDLAKPKGLRLVPVSIFIDGQVQDAAVYLSRPVPMALDSGTIYELDDAGVEKGLVDVKEARHVQIPAAAELAPYDDGWFGYGSFEPPPVPRVTVKKATQQVAVNGKVSDPDRPKFSSKGAQPGTGGSAPEVGSPEDVKVDSGGADDVDRPTLRRRPPVDPKDAKKARKEANQSSVTGEAKSLNDDPDRPRMKRSRAASEDELPPLMGLPADMHQMVAVSDAKRREPHPFARAWEDETEHQAILSKMRAMAMAQLVAYGPVPPGTPTVAAVPAGAATSGATSGASVPPAGGALVSQDTSSGTPPVLRRNHVASNAPAQEQVKAPVPVASGTANKTGSGTTAKAATGTRAATAKKTVAGARTTGTPASRAAAARRAKLHPPVSTAPPPEMTLVDEQVKGYTLSYGGSPTFVYTAHTAGVGARLRYITIVAQEDGPDNLKMALHAVTDAAHLDQQPWMRFVDVVDVEASNRASLLFEMRGQTARQFALYRVIGGKADALFTGGTTQ
jgi:hypothetical protein